MGILWVYTTIVLVLVVYLARQIDLLFRHLRELERRLTKQIKGKSY